jgi:aryl-alcohol dehydrogenase-like predicted oxidoreductase
MTWRADFIPIPGTKQVKYLVENAGAARIAFSQADESRVRKALDAIGGATGARYPERYLALFFSDSPGLEEV